jgi:hypothetical protein
MAQSIVSAVKTDINVIIVSESENFFLHLLKKAETAAIVFGVDIIDKPVIIKLEFLIKLASAAQAFIYILPSGIFSIALLNSSGKIRVYLDNSNVISADLVKEIKTFLYIFEYVLVRGNYKLRFRANETRQSVKYCWSTPSPWHVT